MNRCLQTSALVQRALASADARTLSSSSGHATECVPCRTAVQQVCAFDGALHRAAQSLVVEPLDRPQVWPPYSPRGLSWQRGAVAVAAGVALIITTVLVVAQPLRLAGVGAEPAATPTSMPSANASAEMGRWRASLAALLLGIAPRDVVVTEDGVLGVTYQDGELSLVLVKVVGEEAERLTIASISVEIKDGVSLYAGTAVSCPPDLGLVRQRYLFGYSQGPNPVGPVTLGGLDAIGGGSSTGMHVFAIAPGPLDPDQPWIIETTNGKESGTGRFFEDVRANGALTHAGCRMHR